MSLNTLFETPHRRKNPLTNEWVLVSPHRAQRPWQGQVEKPVKIKLATYEENCYLCPGNARSGGLCNPKYDSTFIFTNDFAALLPDTPHWSEDNSGRGLASAVSETGTCRVMCFSPRHDLTLARMPLDEIVKIAALWAEQYSDLGSQPNINHVQIFENRGEMMGCSNPHPHCQIWATETIPNEPGRELQNQRAYAIEYDSCLLCDYVALELKEKQRVVCENEHFVAIVPFWAVWPYETIVIAKHHVGSLPELTSEGRRDLAEVLKRLTTRYDNLFETPFPYSMGFHQSPTDGDKHQSWHLHAHFLPPLLRSAEVKKFMVGFELLAMPQRDILPETAARTLAALSEQHFLDR